jgi:hypothetical protein
MVGNTKWVMAIVPLVLPPAITAASSDKTGEELESWTRYLSSHPSS